jgi:hypothetical protein
MSSPRFPVALGLVSLLLASAALPACDQVMSGPITDPHLVGVCSDAIPGTTCDLAVSEGKAPALSRCAKLPDGSLLCDSPRVDGPSLPSLEGDHRD